MNADYSIAQKDNAAFRFYAALAEWGALASGLAQAQAGRIAAKSKEVNKTNEEKSTTSHDAGAAGDPDGGAQAPSPKASSA